MPFSLAERAYENYVKKFGRCQTLERIGERGGFWPEEMNDLCPDWREEVEEIYLLRKEVQNLREETESLKSEIENLHIENDTLCLRPQNQQPDKCTVRMTEKPENAERAEDRRSAVERLVIPFLSPAEAERLAFLMEEMGEAQQMIGKILRHGYENYHPEDPEKTSNRVLLSKELGHVFCGIQMLVAPQDISGFILEMSRNEKHEKVKRWMHHQG